MPQKITEVRVYGGRDGAFDLYQDDGTTYGYEKGEYKVTHFTWDDRGRKLTQSGEMVLTDPPPKWVRLVGVK
jgi:alpha-glucosidase (family GH31 glycosyl hydrolase)